MSQNQTMLTNSIVDYIKSHKASLGLLLAVYGAFFLATVIMGNWTPSDWGKDVFDYPKTTFNPLLPRSYISPVFFITSFPLLLTGTTLLCWYTISSLRSGLTVDSEYVAILLVTFGFTYQVIGAWPLGKAVDFPWEWQKQIMSYGPFFAWFLYLLSFLLLLLGAFSLYAHSKDCRQKHPELLTH